MIDTGIPALSWMLIAVFWFRDPESRIFFILMVILLPFYALNDLLRACGAAERSHRQRSSFRASRRKGVVLSDPAAHRGLHLPDHAIGDRLRHPHGDLRRSWLRPRSASAPLDEPGDAFRIDQVLAWTFFLVILNLAPQALVTGLERIALRCACKRRRCDDTEFTGSKPFR